MARVVGDIAVRVGADVTPLQRGMGKANRSVNTFGSNAKKMSVNVAKAGAAVVTAMAAVAAGVLKAANEAAAMGVEIKNLADVAGTSTTVFQRMAAASKTVGIEQEKLSDILKDVNDKFGDYMATGAGPLADFFENIAPKIGVTAAEFANLSGPDALGLYVSSLEKAGVSQQQMTFYMEALASDATALLPLLADNSREFNRLGDAAQEAGRVLSEDAIKNAVELKAELGEMADVMRTQATEAVLEYKDEIIAVADFIVNKLIPAMGEIAGAAISFAEGLAPAIETLKNFLNISTTVLGLDAPFQGAGAARDPNVARAEIDATNALGGSDPSSSGVYYVDENGNVQEYGASTPEIPGITAPAVPLVPSVRASDTGSGSSRGRSGGGSRSTGPTQEDLERLQASYATEREAMDMHLASELEKLEEFRNSKLTSEEEFNELERSIRESHLDDLAQLEADAQRARLQSIAGAFGDLSALMSSENKKLFKIGQAAAIAEATVSGYQAAVSAWQKGMSIGGPPVAAAFTAASLAQTGALISQIKSASSSGGSGGGSASTSSTAATEGSASGPLEVRLSGLGANDLISGADVGDLLERLNEEAGDRGLSLTVAR